jgi:hypothetical protein
VQCGKGTYQPHYIRVREDDRAQVLGLRKLEVDSQNMMYE